MANESEALATQGLHRTITMGRIENSTPVITNAYVVVANDDEPRTSAVDLARPDVRRVSGAFSNIPETVGLAWTDDFFDDDDDVVAAFDLDYERMITYYGQISWAAYIGSIFIPNCFWLGLCFGVPCYLNSNVNWDIRSRHVAITRDGVRYAQGMRKTLWGTSCSNAGKIARTVNTSDIALARMAKPY